MSQLSKIFAKFANATSRFTGKPLTFITCLLLVAVWGVSGPAFGFSDTWQLAINTSTTIITFLMVFLIQNTQNRDNAAIQVKLDELIRAGDSDNKYIGCEHLSDEELNALLAEVEGDAARLYVELRKRSAEEAKGAHASSTATAKPQARRRQSAQRGRPTGSA